MVGLLKGFGSALAGNSKNADEAFEHVRRNARSPEEVETYHYWRALGMAQSQEGKPGALELLSTLERQGPVSARTLGLMAELSADALYRSNEPRDVDSEAVQSGVGLAKRALEQNAGEVRSHRVLGFYDAAQSQKNVGSLQATLRQSALKHFDAVLREGGDDSRVYQEMSWIYRDMARTSDAKASARRANELACSRERNRASCTLMEVQSLLAKRDVSGAKKRTNDFFTKLK